VAPAPVRSGIHGGHWKITQYKYQQLAEQSRGLLRHLASTSPGFGHVPLPARTGAGQVDVGVAGAVRMPALGAVGAAGGHGPVYRYTEPGSTGDVPELAGIK
jgi:hypothetical protein